MRSFWIGWVVGVGVVLAALELPYVNWRSAAPPLDERPLIIRHDAKGDGRFQAPRSGRRQHRGIDLAAAIGDPVRALRSGHVLEIGTHRGFGKFVELEHRGGLRSLYAHLDTIEVEPGAHIRQGQRIGTVGKTGNARSPLMTPHLHVEVAKDGRMIDPASLGLHVVLPHDSEVAADASGGE